MVYINKRVVMIWTEDDCTATRTQSTVCVTLLGGSILVRIRRLDFSEVGLHGRWLHVKTSGNYY